MSVQISVRTSFYLFLLFFLFPSAAAASGLCGPVISELFDAAPSAELCSAGDPGILLGDGPWRWFCVGDDGAAESCAAGRKGHWVGNGPDGGVITAVATDPSRAGVVYAGTDGGGLYRSEDGGLTWLRLNTGPASHIYGLIVGADGRTIHIATWEGVFTSADRGESWAAGTVGLTDSYAFALAADPRQGNTLYVGTWGGGVFKSTDGAVSWQPASDGLTSFSVNALAVDPADGAFLYAATWNGVFRSTDGGGTWTEATAGLDHGIVYAIAVDPSDSATIYAGTSAGIVESADRGVTWRQAAAVAPVRAFGTAGGKMYAATAGDGVFVRQDERWESAGKGGVTSFLALAVDPLDGGTFYAGTDGAGVFRSVDSGSSWAAVSTGMGASSISALAIGNSGSLFAGTTSGSVFSSDNGGGTWTSSAIGISGDPVTALAVDAATGKIYAGTWEGIFFTGGDIQGWQAALTSRLLGVTSLAAAAGAVYAGTDGGVLRSSDGGITWSAVNTGLTSLRIAAVAVAPSAPGHVFAGTPDGLFATADGGAAWDQVPALSGREILAVATDPGNAAVVYAGTIEGVYRSDDGGVTWAEANTGLSSRVVLSLSVDPNGSGVVYAGTYGRVFRSTDGGRQWRSVGSGGESVAARVVAAGRGGGRVYAGTDGGGVMSFTTVPISGTCGASNGGRLVTAPSSGLCSTGTAGEVAGEGPWTWTCAGSDGGADASCAADRTTFTVSTVAGVGGSIAAFPLPVGFMTVHTFPVVPDDGYRVVSVTGCGGELSGVFYTTAPIVADCTVTAVFARDPIKWTVPVTSLSIGWKKKSATISFTASAVEPVTGVTVAARSMASWITVTGDGGKLRLKKGVGRGKVMVAIAENPSSVPRSGTITVNGVDIAVTQAGAPCVIRSVSATARSLPAEGGALAVTVDAPFGCSWQVVSLDPQESWLVPTVTAGDGVLTFSVSSLANSAPDPEARPPRARKAKLVVKSVGPRPSQRILSLSQPGA